MSMNTNPNLTGTNSGQAHHHSHLLSCNHLHNAPLAAASPSTTSVPLLASSQLHASSTKMLPHYQYHHHHHHNHLHSHNLAGLPYARSSVPNRSDSSEHHPTTNQLFAASDMSTNVSSNSPLSYSYSSHHFNFLNGSLLLSFIFDQIDSFFISFIHF
jgi:hypothetical protein